MNFKNQMGGALKIILIIVAVIIAIIFVAEKINQNAYRNEQREKIVAYNKKVEEYNKAIQEKNNIVKQYPYLNVTFIEAKIVPIEIADAKDIDSIYYKLKEYEDENDSIVDYNEQQHKIGIKNMEKYNKTIDNFSTLLGL